MTCKQVSGAPSAL